MVVPPLFGAAKVFMAVAGRACVAASFCLAVAVAAVLVSRSVAAAASALASRVKGARAASTMHV